ncbi:MAG: hypothetical protein ACOZF2_00620 [Thermodesulfobacteriota bacterium]
MPDISKDKVGWNFEGLFIQEADGSRYLVRKDGVIKRICTATIRANDVNIENKIMIDTSFSSGVVGMSGGPIIMVTTKEVIGLMCVGLPPDVKIKNQIMAISTDEIIKVL